MPLFILSQPKEVPLIANCFATLRVLPLSLVKSGVDSMNKKIEHSGGGSSSGSSDDVLRFHDVTNDDTRVRSRARSGESLGIEAVALAVLVDRKRMSSSTTYSG